MQMNIKKIVSVAALALVTATSAFAQVEHTGPDPRISLTDDRAFVDAKRPGVCTELGRLQLSVATATTSEAAINSLQEYLADYTTEAAMGFEELAEAETDIGEIGLTEWTRGAADRIAEDMRYHACPAETPRT